MVHISLFPISSLFPAWPSLLLFNSKWLFPAAFSFLFSQWLLSFTGQVMWFTCQIISTLRIYYMLNFNNANTSIDTKNNTLKTLWKFSYMASTSAKLYWSKYLRREASDNQPSTRTYQPANSMGLQQLSKTGRAGKPVLANPQIPSLFLVHITIKPSRHYLASSITNFRMNRWHLSHKYLILMAEIVC